jgi:WD40 repeat protein
MNEDHAGRLRRFSIFPRTVLVCLLDCVFCLTAISCIRHHGNAAHDDETKVRLVRRYEEGVIESLAFRADGRSLALSSSRGSAWTVDAFTGDVQWRVSREGGPVRSIAYRPDGLQIAIGVESGFIDIFNRDDVRPALSWKAHSGFISAVAYRDDGRSIASASDDGSVGVWEADTGRSLLTLTGHGGSVWSVAYSPDGQRLASASDDRTVRVWDASTGRPLFTLSGTHLARSVAFSPDGRYLAAGWGDGTARVYDATNGRLVKTLNHRPASQINGVAFSPGNDGLLATACANAYRGDPPGTVHLWDVAEGRSTLEFCLTGWAMCVAFNPAGTVVASGGRDGSLHVWDVRPRSADMRHTAIP